MKHNIGDVITYELPFSGFRRGYGRYKAEVLGIEEQGVYKLKVLEVIQASANPIAPQQPGDIDYVLLE